MQNGPPSDLTPWTLTLTIVQSCKTGHTLAKVAEFCPKIMSSFFSCRRLIYDMILWSFWGNN